MTISKGPRCGPLLFPVIIHLYPPARLTNMSSQANYGSHQEESWLFLSNAIIWGVSFCFLLSIVCVMSAKPARAQCVVPTGYTSCSSINCSSSTQIRPPAYDATGYFPEYMQVSCCGTNSISAISYYITCYSAELRDPKVQERLIQMALLKPLYTVNCDGWVRPFTPSTDRSREPRRRGASR